MLNPRFAWGSRDVDALCCLAVDAGGEGAGIALWYGKSGELEIGPNSVELSDSSVESTLKKRESDRVQNSEQSEQNLRPRAQTSSECEVSRDGFVPPLINRPEHGPERARVGTADKLNELSELSETDKANETDELSETNEAVLDFGRRLQTTDAAWLYDLPNSRARHEACFMVVIQGPQLSRASEFESAPATEKTSMATLVPTRGKKSGKSRRVTRHSPKELLTRTDDDDASGRGNDDDEDEHETQDPPGQTKPHEDE
ncbi:hypothetical protein PHYSODRAFT_341520 [Phytophthora sojae]|uniref:Uncharacterized protein n=1 Tax=Phytophthora sojae (strain P6497) TaxID=1094619 RepID=G5ADI1_PHYSP|nr:hypothetical protein PHYSODRAFT_341520 [Phytophthora sojae]EGZ06234.1 hypothetical protein PHYSODRAFT_341520 [Phytophthora sojae]|eukprot:XP_009538131.1 hypothetical protein PHYSODRAFT_341520 [Phytophthora sojae]